LFLSKGGTERVAANLASAMVRRGHRVTLVYCQHPGNKSEPVYAIAPACALLRGPTQRWSDIRDMREILRACGADVFLSMASSRTHLLWAVSVMGTGVPFVCSERNHPQYIEQAYWNKAGREAVLSGADIIHELLPDYASLVPLPWQNKVRVIGNCSPEAAVPRADVAGLPGRRCAVLYLARFAPQKFPDLLLRAFALLQHDFSEWDVHIRGHGPLENSLRKLARECAPAGRVLFRESAEDSLACYSAAQVYCLPSLYEGFPNTVLEAMSAGLPCVGFADCTGVSSLVRDNVNGLLAEERSAEKLAIVLSRLMGDVALRLRLGQGALETARAYEPEVIWNQWEALLQEAASKKNHTVMDSFSEEPFACRARLSAAARREWLYRDFGMPMPWSFAWLASKAGAWIKRLSQSLRGAEPRIAALRMGHKIFARHTLPTFLHLWRLRGLHFAVRHQRLCRKIYFPSLLRRLRASGLFDPEWYMERHSKGPQVIDPLEHYIRRGSFADLQPNPWFKAKWYRATRMGQSRLNPLLHYLLRGRETCPPSAFSVEISPRVASFLAQCAALGIELPRQSSILDFGCGAGDFVCELDKLGYSARGYDIRNYLSKQAAQRPELFIIDNAHTTVKDFVPNVEHPLLGVVNYQQHWDNWRLPYPDGDFDCVVSFNVFEHIFNHDVALKEIARILKPAGVSFHTYPPKGHFLESHTRIPLGHRLRFKWYYYFWALIGCRMKGQKNVSTALAAGHAYNYMQRATNYISDVQMLRISRKYFNHTKIENLSSRKNIIKKLFYTIFPRSVRLVLRRKI
jgi:glycosyltransferase involved in cell wall biosynthesis/SAM-dependent methyltransferase